LKSINIPDNVTSIGNYAFCNCSSLSSLTIPTNVKTIGSYAFDRCSSLTSLTIPENVTTIGDYAFEYCSKLSSVTYLGNTNLKQCPNNVFSSCNALPSICVKFDYKGTSFCGKNVPALNSTSFNRLRNQTNHCYNMIVCNSSYGSIIKRPNVSEWESHTNGCFEYACSNESGGVVWSKCNSSETVDRVCMDDKCIEKEKEKVNESDWTVEIDFNDVDLNGTDLENIISTIVNVSQVDPSKMNIVTKMNEKGQIVHITVILGDENYAEYNQYVGKKISTSYVLVSFDNSKWTVLALKETASVQFVNVDDVKDKIYETVTVPAETYVH